MRKPTMSICENKGADLLRSYRLCLVTTKLISAFVFATQIIQSLFFVNPKFQVSSLLEMPQRRANYVVFEMASALDVRSEHKVNIDRSKETDRFFCEFTNIRIIMREEKQRSRKK